MNKKTKIIFLVSLTLNIFFISFYAGHLLNKSHDKNFSKQEKELTNLLDKKNRTIASETFKELFELRKQSFNQRKEIFRNLETIVVANEFDEKKFLLEMSKLHEISNSSIKESDQKLAQLLTKLSIEERTKVVEKIKKNFLKRRF